VVGLEKERILQYHNYTYFFIMERITITPRNNWQEAVEKLGFGFHSTNVPYWNESAYYSFTMDEILSIEKTTAELWEMCLIAVQYAIDNDLFYQFRIPVSFIPYIKKTWKEDYPSVYGRFDFCYKDGQIKMLEFNADTPTSLYEAGVIQWFWLQDFDATKDQFNSIHEKLIGQWKFLHTYLYKGILHFGCVKESLEDLTNTEYLRDCAMQAGIASKLLFMDDIGWDDSHKYFVDLENEPIKNMFKLYPWEWMVNEEFGKNITTDKNKTIFIEPAWKMILSNKAILPLLWQLFPGHKNLLPSYFQDTGLSSYIKKPILSREGANIDIVVENDIKYSTIGDYGKEGFIYQDLFTLPSFAGNYPVVGSWVIGQEPAGIGIRESDNLITDNLSRFVPHLIG
jgi:glutathionylspermidine synthase